MVAEEQTNDPSADTVATGSNADYRGGDIANNGVAGQGPVRNAHENGVPGGTGAAPAPPPPPARDMTEAPQIECDESGLRNFFPDEAQERGITNIRVRLRVTVDGSGRITRAQATEDPGFGLARAAERAMVNACTSTVPRGADGAATAVTRAFTLVFELE